MRLSLLALAFLGCAAPHRPQANDSCSAGWQAFSRGDARGALSNYRLCEQANPKPRRSILPPDAGLEAFETLAEETAADGRNSEADRRRRCPRTTAIEEATYALRVESKGDERGFKHYMAAACVDALVGQSAMNRSVHPCALLASPPRSAEINVVIRQLAAVTPPACFGDPSPERYRGPDGWNCAPGGVPEERDVFPPD